MRGGKRKRVESEAGSHRKRQSKYQWSGPESVLLVIWLVINNISLIKRFAARQNCVNNCGAVRALCNRYVYY
jgi:hypothetical protein